ncbi:hypothetical protein AcW1_001583 [Taiwanofungus camphoratus]|nr:hypothetical protein AcV7_003569 [Antrodia cinnamomea]KAI0938767.1 hypothetical protein AcV5_000376 [Antrodia cinnamomea]KAI0945339.1 hypothetical protein AcW1_001583 [Antrodia cinnamomea]
MNTPLLRGQVLPAQAPARCHWNQGSCSAHIHDRTPAGVEQHLRQYHFNSSPWHKKNVGLSLAIISPRSIYDDSTSILQILWWSLYLYLINSSGAGAWVRKSGTRSVFSFFFLRLCCSMSQNS